MAKTKDGKKIVSVGPHKRKNPGGQRRTKPIGAHKRSTPKPRA